MKMSEKQRRFADYYIENPNASEAARRAGYSAKTAHRTGQENMQKPAIRAYIDERMAQLKSERVADQQEIMEYLTSVLRGDAAGTALVGVGMGEQTVEQVPPTVAERTAAAINLGKRYAMWTEKQQVENITPIFVEDVPQDD